MTYRLDSDIIYTNSAKLIPNKNYLGGFDSKRNYLEAKNKTAIVLISNCQQDRLRVVTKLKKYIDVDIRGDCVVFHVNHVTLIDIQLQLSLGF